MTGLTVLVWMESKPLENQGSGRPWTGPFGLIRKYRGGDSNA